MGWLLLGRYVFGATLVSMAIVMLWAAARDR